MPDDGCWDTVVVPIMGRTTVSKKSKVKLISNDDNNGSEVTIDMSKFSDEWHSVTANRAHPRTKGMKNKKSFARRGI